MDGQVEGDDAVAAGRIGEGDDVVTGGVEGVAFVSERATSLFGDLVFRSLQYRQVDGDDAVAVAAGGETLCVGATCIVGGVIPSVGAAVGDVKRGFGRLADVDDEGEGTVAAVSGGVRIEEFAGGGVRAEGHVFGFVGEGQLRTAQVEGFGAGVGGMEGEVERDDAVAAVGGQQVLCVIARFIVGFIIPDVFTAGFVAELIGGMEFLGHIHRDDAVAAAAEGDGIGF